MSGMFHHRRISGLAVAAMALFGLGTAGAGASVLPVGVQLGVANNTVHNVWGWTECFSDDGLGTRPIASVLGSCTGDYLMLGVRDSNGDYAILAAADYADVTFDTGRQTGFNDVTHTANGTEWYFNADWSWGFTELGNSVDLTSCDLDINPQGGNIGMCWHTDDGEMGVGWLFNDGTPTPLFNNGYERVVLTGLASVPEPAALGLFGLGLAGLGLATRRRRR